MTPNSTALCALACTLFVAASAGAAPVISPYASDLAASSYSASSTYASETAQSVFNGGHWNAGSRGVHWVQADLGQTQLLSQVRLTVDVWPWNNTWQRVYLSDIPIGNLYSLLTPVASRSGYTRGGDQFTLAFAPAAGRYLQVLIYGGTSWTALGDGSARVNWTDPAARPAAGPSVVPEPGSLALVLAAFGALVILRRGCAARA